MKNNDLVLDSSVVDLIQQEMGVEVPEPGSLEFQAFIEELQADRPDLFDAVMQGLQVNVKLPAEEQAQRVARREGVNNFITKTFFRKSSVDGAPVAAKRRWITYFFGGLAFLLPVLYIFGQTLGGSSNAKTANNNPEDVQTIEASALPIIDTSGPDLAALTAPKPAPVAEPEPTTPEPASVGVLPPPNIPAPPPPLATPVALQPPTPAPAPAPAPGAGVGTTTPGSTGAAGSVAGLEEALPDTLTAYSYEGPLPQSLTVLQDSETSQSLLIAGEEETLSRTLSVALPEQAPTEETGNQIGNQNSSQAANVSNVTTAQKQSNPAAISAAASPRPKTLSLSPSSPSSSLSASASTPTASALTSNSASTVSANAQTQTAQTQVDASQIATTAKVKNPLDDYLRPGMRVPATLITGIVVAQGATIPVVAETNGEWCGKGNCPKITWLGVAYMDGTSRVQIVIERAVVGPNLQTVSGLGMGPDYNLGLNARIRDEAPTLFQDLFRNTLGGVTDYVDALSNQQKVTIVDGVVIQQSQTPSIDKYMLGRATGTFDLPVGSSQIIRLAEVPPTTPMVVLYGVGPETAQAP